MYAIAVLIDRFIVTKSSFETDRICILCKFSFNFALGAIPFGVTLPEMWTILLSLCIAVSYAASIYFLYESLNNSNASEVVPVIGESQLFLLFP